MLPSVRDQSSPTTFFSASLTSQLHQRTTSSHALLNIGPCHQLLACCYTDISPKTIVAFTVGTFSANLPKATTFFITNNLYIQILNYISLVILNIYHTFF
ncbi:hypothetical protein AAHE18_15G168100 [Arachis hypogaea]